MAGWIGVYAIQSVANRMLSKRLNGMQTKIDSLLSTLSTMRFSILHLLLGTLTLAVVLGIGYPTLKFALYDYVNFTYDRDQTIEYVEATTSGQLRQTCSKPRTNYRSGTIAESNQTRRDCETIDADIANPTISLQRAGLFCSRQSQLSSSRHDPRQCDDLVLDWHARGVFTLGLATSLAFSVVLELL